MPDDRYDVIIIGSGPGNPTLTIIAHALRVGEHIKDRLG